MSAITYSLNKVRLAIPDRILRLAFTTKSEYYRTSNTTLDKQIEDLVIKPIVLTDLNVVGGTILKVPLLNCNVTEYNNGINGNNLIINIPYAVTNNKKVLTPLSMTTTNNVSNVSKGNPLVDAASRIIDHSMGSSDGMLFSNLELIGGNTILVHDDVPFTTRGVIDVLIENNSNLSNLKPKTYPKFSKLVILAVKAYIYNKLALELDEGGLYYGHNLSKMSDIIGNYESSLEDYDEAIASKWAKILFMNDDVQMSSYVKLLVNPNI